MRRMLFTAPEQCSFPAAQHQNTFRRGDKWADLQPQQIIELASSHNEVVFGRARVLVVSTGPLNVMLNRFASNNHGLTQAIVDGDIQSTPDAIEMLTTILAGIYPGLKSDEVFTVVHLEHVD